MKKTNEQFLKEVYDLVGNSYEVLEPYSGSMIKIKIKHKECGHKYEVRPNDFFRGRRCPNCLGGVSNTKGEVDKVINERGFTRVGEYINALTPITLKTSEGYLFVITFANLKTGQGITLFGKSNPYTIKNINLWCKLNDKPFELISDKYEGNLKKLEWRCLKENCKEIFFISWGSVSQGRGCSYCTGKSVGESNNLINNYPKLADEWDYIKNYPLTPYEVSSGSDKKVWWKCSKCGHEWKAIIGERKRGSGCPKCYESKGEKIVVEYLINNNFNFVREYRMKDCKNKRPLPFDFAVFLNEKLLCLIEYDGEQHFRPIGRLRTNEFNVIKKRDSIKTEFCNKNKIPLVRIPYTTNDVEKYLDEKLALIL